MATQPTNDVLVWANTDVNLPNLAGPNKTEPSADLVAKGWDFKQKPSADEFNYILNNLSEWVEYLRTLTAEGTSLNTPSTFVERDASGNFAASTITAALSGNASTATKWQTPRTLTATGFATGTATDIDGSGNINLSLSMGSGFTNSKTTHGYTNLPNGLILQWGAVIAGDDNLYQITFPVTFPTACFAMSATPEYYEAITGTNVISAHVSNVTESSFYVGLSASIDINATTVYWTAIGY